MTWPRWFHCAHPYLRTDVEIAACGDVYAHNEQAASIAPHASVKQLHVIYSRVVRYALTIVWATAGIAIAGCVQHPLETASPARTKNISLLPSRRDTSVATEVVEISRSFRGTAIVIYGQPSGEIGTRQADTLRYVMPADGLLRVQRPEPWGYTAMFIRVRDDSALVNLLSDCDSDRASPGSASGVLSGCWLPRVLTNAPNIPAYVAFYIGIRGNVRGCTTIGVSVIENVMFGEPVKENAAQTSHCQEMQRLK